MAESLTTDVGPRAHSARFMAGPPIPGHSTSCPHGLARAYFVRSAFLRARKPQTAHLISQRGFDGN